MVLHDYVLDPVPMVPVRRRGAATFEELFEVFADNHGVAMVGANDPDRGPYSRCIRVADIDVEAYRRKGYRALTGVEKDRIFSTVDDFGDATD